MSRRAREHQIDTAADRQPDETGVVLLGGAHSALALARSFGRAGVPVVALSDDHQLPRLSRYVRHSFRWPGGLAPHADNWLVKFASEQNLQDWLLFPCADTDVRFVAENLTRLRSAFKVIGPDWNVLEKVCDKQRLAETAACAGVAFPKNYRIRSADDAAIVDVQFPVVLKPANGVERNAVTSFKAWQADSRDELIGRYREGAGLVGEHAIVVQELVPGLGETQFSYAALWHDNAPLAEIVARRTRQYPIDFSTSTFVEIVSNSSVVEAGRTLLSSIGFEGLVEAEFKFDPRDGSYKVLDVNPRPWSWMGLCEAAGVNFPMMARDMALGRTVAPATLDPRHAWMHVVRDVFAAMQLIARGHITIGDYVRSVRGKPVFATFAWDDPLPGLLELPLTAYRVVGRALSALVHDSDPVPPKMPSKTSGQQNSADATLAR